MAKRILFAYLRKTISQQRLENKYFAQKHEPANCPRETCETNEINMRLHKAIAKLPPKTRQSVEAAFIHSGRAMKKNARPDTAQRKRSHRAIKSLRKNLANS
jgi:DNA-directed RNA polymerase specialized sigma24 family protein